MIEKHHKVVVVFVVDRLYVYAQVSMNHHYVHRHSGWIGYYNIQCKINPSNRSLHPNRK
jgi:hypothetical protein